MKKIIIWAGLLLILGVIGLAFKHFDFLKSAPVEEEGFVITSSEPPPSETGRAHLNETVSVMGVNITPLELKEDSRCPVDVTCIQGGRVEVWVKIQTASRDYLRYLTIENGATVSEYLEDEGLRVLLTRVEPEVRTGRAIESSDYFFHFEMGGEPTQ